MGCIITARLAWLTGQEGERNHVTVPISSREVPPGMFKVILRQANLSLQKFEVLVER